LRRCLTRREAAEFLSEQGLQISANTLQKFATTGGGPDYRIFGNRAVYTPADLLAWAEERMRPA